MRILGADFCRRRQTAEPCTFQKCPQNPHPKSDPRGSFWKEAERWSACQGIWGQLLGGSSRVWQGCWTWLLIVSCLLPLLDPLLQILWFHRPPGPNPFRDFFWQKSGPSMLRNIIGPVFACLWKTLMRFSTPPPPQKEKNKTVDECLTYKKATIWPMFNSTECMYIYICMYVCLSLSLSLSLRPWELRVCAKKISPRFIVSSILRDICVVFSKRCRTIQSKYPFYVRGYGAQRHRLFLLQRVKLIDHIGRTHSKSPTVP